MTPFQNLSETADTFKTKFSPHMNEFILGNQVFDEPGPAGRQRRPKAENAKTSFPCCQGPTMVDKQPRGGYDMISSVDKTVFPFLPIKEKT